MSNIQIVIDGNSIFAKCFFWMKDNEASNSQGFKTGGLFSFLRYMNSLKKEFNLPNSHFHVTFDNKYSKDKRLQVFSDYKAWRSNKDENYYQQLNILRNILIYSWINVYSLAMLEADDLCFRLSLDLSKQQDTQVIVVSRDKDLLSCLFLDNVTVRLDLPKWKKMYTRETFEEEYGFKCHHFIDYKSTYGDTSDNIPWVKWLGEAGLKSFFSELGDNRLQTLIEKTKNSEEIDLSTKNKKVLQKIIDNENDFNLSKELVKPIYQFKYPEDFISSHEVNIEELNKIYNWLEIKENRLPLD